MKWCNSIQENGDHGDWSSLGVLRTTGLHGNNWVTPTCLVSLQFMGCKLSRQAVHLDFDASGLCTHWLTGRVSNFHQVIVFWHQTHTLNRMHMHAESAPWIKYCTVRTQVKSWTSLIKQCCLCTTINEVNLYTSKIISGKGIRLCYFSTCSSRLQPTWGHSAIWYRGECYGGLCCLLWRRRRRVCHDAG